MKLKFQNIIIAILAFTQLVSCTNNNNQKVVKDESILNNEIWFKQASLSLGYRIEMADKDFGYAVSRGKGDFENGGEKGEFLIFNNGEWTAEDNYGYSDYPNVKIVNENTAWYLTHSTYQQYYKPHLYSYSNNKKKEIKLPKVMWDGTDYAMWFSLSATPSGKAYLVGQKGNILFYNGNSWKEVQSPVKNNNEDNIIAGDLHDVYMITDSLGWAVGKAGIILKFENGIWLKYKSPVNIELNKVRFINNENGWIVGERGTILKYKNGNWESIKNDYRVNFYSLKIINENKVYITGANSSLILYENQKLVEVESIKIFDDDFQDISIVEENGKDNIWIIGNNGIYTNTQSLSFSFTDITSQSSLRKEGVGGIFFDINKDNFPDLFLINEKAPNLLYKNLGNNSFSEATSFLSASGNKFFSQFNALGDINNDGYTDVLEIMDDLHYRLSFGEGEFSFRENTSKSFLKLNFIQSDLHFSTAAKFADFNNDGNLDLYISNYDSEDMLFKNNGIGKFENVYNSSGIKKYLKHRSYGAVISDFNNDNLVDIFLIYRAPEKGKHLSLFLNKGNFNFEEKDNAAFYANLSPSTFSALASDFNNDGFSDLLIYNSAEKLKLLINNGDASFINYSDSVGLTEKIVHPEPVNGILASADVNNDGWMDFFVGSKLFLNSPGLYFNEVTEESGINFTGNPSFADVDNDGDMDLFVGSSVLSMGEGIRAALYRNNLLNSNFLNIKLNADLSNRSGIGSKILLKGFNNKGILKYITIREVGLGSAPMLQNDFSQTQFGIDTSLNYSAVITFPSGIQKTITDPERNGTIEVRESALLAHIIILAGKSLQRTVLLINWPVEISKFAIFILIVAALFIYGNKTKAKQYLKKWYLTPAILLTYFLIMHLNVNNSQYLSTSIAYSIPVLLLLLFIKTTSDIVNRKESKYVSHYKLLEILGVGGTGQVFKAIDIHENKTVAVKVLNQNLLKDEENRKRLNSEGRLLSSMNHQNIVKVFEFGETEKHSFIAMEYLSGGTLEEYIENNYPISNEIIYTIVEQICAGLLEIHSNNIIHRDLKSQNIMFDQNNNIRIMDFGLSKSPLVSTMTSLGTVVGTLGYVAPEQVTNMYIDQRCDIFSLGVIIYKMITNKLPFTGENEIALIHSIFNTQPPMPRLINKKCTVDLEKITLRCIEKEPDGRFTNVEELLVQIRNNKKLN